MENKEEFNYTYSAHQQQEIQHIRNSYLPKEENKMEQLRALHRIPAHKAQAASIALGVMGALVMGSGMSLLMTPLGEALGGMAAVAGILTGVAGMIMVALAYPVYTRVLEAQRKKIAPQILSLTDELMK